jgi:hypothetical protein
LTHDKTIAELKPEAELLSALGSLYPQHALPTALAVGYQNTPEQGLVLKLSMQIERAAFEFEQAEQKREVDVIGAAIDDRGLIVSFKQLLTVAPDAAAQRQGLPVLWHQQLRLQPGLYQVRVAVRERASGRTGSAQQWIEVPDLSQGSMQMSSLFLAERKAANGEQAKEPRVLLVDVDHRFARSSVLRYQTYIYNAVGSTAAAAAPELSIQARVLRDGRAVITMPPGKVPVGDATSHARLPYWSEVPLADLTPGRYLLQVVATDKRAATSATQRLRFIVE